MSEEMLLSSLVDTVLTEVSGKRAWDWVNNLTRFHRVQGSPGYSEAAKRILKALESLDLDLLELKKYPADGISASWEYFPPYSWKISSGELWLVEPHRELLSRFNELPMSVVTHSESCDITAEIIDVGKGSKKEDYEGKEVKNKIVLMSGSPRKYHDLAIDAGAVGLIIYPEEEKAAGYPDMTLYDGIWPTKENRDKVTFGFSISAAQAVFLKKMLQNGQTVTVHGKIDAQLYNGELEVIDAAIKGTAFFDEEIILIAHLCHPAASANDNASGSAGLLELVRSLRSLIRNKLVKPPKRTVRFLWVPEFHGTIKWLKEKESKLKKVLTCINLDMIGEDPVKIGYPFSVMKAPYSTPSVVNDLIEYYVKQVADHPKGIAINGSKAPLRYRFRPFSGGSDHMLFADSHFGIPGVMFGHADMFHHTSLDTIDKCDPTEMQRVIGIALCTILCFSSLDEMNITDLLPFVQSGIFKRQSKTIELLGSLQKEIEIKMRKESVNTLEEVSESEKIFFGYTLIEAEAFYERELLKELKENYSENKFIDTYISTLERDLKSWVHSQTYLWQENHRRMNIDLQPDHKLKMLSKTYKRLFDGPVPFRKFGLVEEKPVMKLFMKRTPPWNYGGLFFELLNLVGLNFPLEEIAGALSLQYNRLFYPSEVNSLLRLLIKEEIIKEEKDQE
ncbi:MAG: DUF4910 domain-containing protein [Candidatus Hodarchaeales archaeon]|jgi:hypothetical protein